ncbi:MAG: hypothetical protein VX262_04105 [Acidobacteriota bacterium]|nr:hypothetical protein [Acidobacteriota bacterium]
MPTGLILVLAASVLHCWYSGHAAEPIRLRAIAHQRFGLFILLLSIALLGVGVSMIWSESGFVVGLMTVGAYFFALPMIVMPVLEALGVVPR